MAYLVKPFSITDLIPAIEVAVCRFEEVLGLEKEVASFRPARDAQTHRAGEGPCSRSKGRRSPRHSNLIQRAAMDRRTTMKHVAEVVLETLDSAENPLDIRPACASDAAVPCDFGMFSEA